MKAKTKSWYLKGTLLNWFETTDKAAELARVFTIYGIYESGIGLEKFNLSQEDIELLEKMKALPHNAKSKLFESVMIKEYNGIGQGKQPVKQESKQSSDKVADQDQKDTVLEKDLDIKLDIEEDSIENNQEDQDNDTENNFFATAPQ